MINKFDIKISKSDLELARQSVFSSLQKDFELPGFRKGKVPLDKVEKNYNPAVIMYEAERIALDHALDKHIKSLDINFYPDSIKVNDRKEEGDEIVFSCELEVEPVFELPEITEAKDVKKYDNNVDEKEFEEYKDSVRKSLAMWGDPKDKLKLDETSYLRIKIECLHGDHGHVYPRSWFSTAELKDFPGLSDKIDELLSKGNLEYKVKIAKDQKDFELTEFLGKETQVKVEFLDHKVQTLPDFDDEMALKLGFKDIVDCREQVLKAFGANKLREKKVEAENEFLDSLLKKLKFEVPEVLFTRVINRRKEDIIKNLSQRQLTFEDYLKNQNLDEAAWFDQQKKLYEPMLKRQMLLDKYMMKFDFVPSHDDIHALMELYESSNQKISHDQAEYSVKQQKFFEKYLHGNETK